MPNVLRSSPEARRQQLPIGLKSKPSPKTREGNFRTTVSLLIPEYHKGSPATSWLTFDGFLFADSSDTIH